MNGPEFRAALDALGWSQRGLAERLGVAATTTQRWASGRHPIPENVAAWLRLWAAHATSHPLPEGWTARLACSRPRRRRARRSWC